MTEVIDKYKSRRLTQEQFLERVRSVHGDRYDYSETVFLSVKTKVKIRCRIHGEFTQKPSAHFLGHGCAKCDPTASKGREHFVTRAKEVHNDTYDYSKVNYVNSHTKVIIKCRLHGEFTQKPYCHLVGQGCRVCGNLAKTLTHQEFIDRSTVIHNNTYDYSKVDYKNSYTKVSIVCPTHGVFLQKPSTHLKGHGCYKCGVESTRRGKDAFIEKSNKVHNNKYDYSKVELNVTRDYINIICPIHGKFRQSANNHLNGFGCTECSNKPKRVFNVKQFISRAKKIHNGRYDYSKVQYVDSLTKVTITCKKSNHGDFEQKPHNHLKGHGCPICSASKGELLINDLLLKKGIEFKDQYIIPETDLTLRYDFYLPEYDLLIEFHGKQHYEYIPFFHRGSEDNFIMQKNRDNIVRHLAKSHKYNYLEFSYKQLDSLSKEEFEELVLSKITRYKKRTRKQVVSRPH